MTHRLELGVAPMNAAGVIAPVLLALALLAPTVSRAEPYLAVRTGAKCMACHVNPTGGGKRTEFGSIYSQTALAEAYLNPATGETMAAPEGGPQSALWTGKLNDHLAVGSDLRASLQG